MLPVQTVRIFTGAGADAGDSKELLFPAGAPDQDGPYFNVARAGPDPCHPIWPKNYRDAGAGPPRGICERVRGNVRDVRERLRAG
jgi:hypothetical protein